MKGQINLEFLFAALFYLAAAGGLLYAGTDVLPNLEANAENSNLYTEAHTVSTKLLSKPGYTDHGNFRSWEKNDSTVDAATSIGISSSERNYLVVDPAKLDRLQGFSSAPGTVNYSEFKRISEADNQYRFNFTWMPVGELGSSYFRYETADFTVDEDDELVGYWKFDEENTDSDPGPNSIVGDSSGNGNDGTAYGNFGFDQPGIRGTSSYRFDSAEYVRIPESYSSQNATISMWIDPETLMGRQRFLNISGADSSFSLDANSGSANIRYLSSGSSEDIYSGELKQGWNHVTAVIYRDGNYSLYIDGNLKGSGTSRENLQQINPDDLIIGAGDQDRTESDEEGFTGKIDDVRIYNRSLSAERIQKIHRGEDEYVKEGAGKIVAPDESSEYTSSGNRVRFGRGRIGSTYPHFLAVSHDGEYDRIYVSNTWNFEGRNPVAERESFSFQGETFRLNTIQNTGQTKGNAVVLQQHLKSFGPEPAEQSTVITLERFASYRGEPLKMEVLSW